MHARPFDIARPMPDLPYRLGLPIWAHPGWRNRYFEWEPSPLASYARVFDAVEGNTTFYGIKDRATVDGWRRALEGSDLRVSFKPPMAVTHSSAPDMDALEHFLDTIGALDEHLGPYLLQFPSRVGPETLARFEPAFERVAREAPGAVVEVRNLAFFEDAATLGQTLDRYGFGRVTLDSRALYAGDPTHPKAAGALHKKPDVPVLDHDGRATAFVRLILHPDARTNVPWLDEWAGRTAALLAEGVTVTMIVHCPDNDPCPDFAADFHERLRVACAGGAVPTPEPLPRWPVPQQGSLL